MIYFDKVNGSINVRLDTEYGEVVAVDVSEYELQHHIPPKDYLPSDILDLINEHNENTIGSISQLYEYRETYSKINDNIKEIDKQYVKDIISHKEDEINKLKDLVGIFSFDLFLDKFGYLILVLLQTFVAIYVTVYEHTNILTSLGVILSTIVLAIFVKLHTENS